jgi:hypothetical protein
MFILAGAAVEVEIGGRRAKMNFVSPFATCSIGEKCTSRPGAARQPGTRSYIRLNPVPPTNGVHCRL